MEYTIYSLKDPNTNELVYIGRTTSNINLRLIGHLKDAYTRKRNCSKKSNWIKSLLEQSKIPIIEVIEKTNNASREAELIKKYQPIYNIIFNNKTPKGIKGNIIYQYDLDGNFIREFRNTLIAAAELNIDSGNIYSAILGLRRQAYGYMWKDYKYEKINKYRKNVSMKEVHMYSLTGEYLKTFPSARSVPNIPYKGISKCCRGKCKTTYGYIFSFEKKEKI